MRYWYPSNATSSPCYVCAMIKLLVINSVQKLGQPEKCFLSLPVFSQMAFPCVSPVAGYYVSLGKQVKCGR